MKWQRARNVEGSVGFLFWVEAGSPKLMVGVDELEPHNELATIAYRTNLLAGDGTQLCVDKASVELTAYFAVDVPLVDLRSELVAQGFTETGHAA